MDESAHGVMKESRYHPLGVALFACVVVWIAVAVAVSYVRENGSDWFAESSSPCPHQTAKIAEQWLHAVQAGDEKRSLLLAKRLVPETEMALPRLDYMRIFGMNGINLSFLTVGFGRIDALRWFDAAFFAKIANDLAPDPENEIRDLLAGVVAAIRPTESIDSRYPPLRSSEIWQRGHGNVSDRIRVFAELCRQKGYETRLIQFRDSDNGNILTQCCELDRNGRRTVVDVANGREIGDVPLQRIMPEPLRKGGRAVMRILVMAESADYRTANQLLAGEISRVAGDSDPIQFPAFGQDPFTEIEEYLERFGNVGSGAVGYWQIPLIALHAKQHPPLPAIFFRSGAGDPVKSNTEKDESRQDPTNGKFDNKN